MSAVIVPFRRAQRALHASLDFEDELRQFRPATRAEARRRAQKYVREGKPSTEAARLALNWARDTDQPIPPAA